MKQVLLTGIYGTYNYGCEAIVRGTVEILRKFNPEIEISYASYDYEADCKRLNDLNINIIKRPDKFKKWTLQNILWKVLRMVKVRKTRPFDSLSWVKGFDTVFSIGGDMYTLGSNNSYKIALPLYFEDCQKKGMKYVLWGASVGPFEKNPAALDFYKSHLAKIDVIFSRESATTDYLKEIGISKNVIFAPDPAFSVPGPVKTSEKPEKISNIGINLSLLSASHAYASVEEAIKAQASTIDNLISHFNCNVTLIPHVVSPRYWEDDKSYLDKVRNAVSENNQSKVTLVREDVGFVGTKDILKKMDVVIAARMHCGINAICTGVPVIFLSYSAKAKGMSKLIYGHDEYVIPLPTFANSDFIVDKIKKIKRPDIEKIRQFDFTSLLSSL